MIKKAIQTIRLFFLKIKYGKRLNIGRHCYIPLSTVIRLKDDSRIIIRDNVEFRSNCILNCSSNGNLTIEKGSFFNDFVFINCRKSVIIGENVQIGQGAKIYDHDHNYKKQNFKNEFLCDDVKIGDNSWIGCDVVILRGTVVGKNCIVGAGTICKSIFDDDMVIFDKKTKIQKKFERELANARSNL